MKAFIKQTIKGTPIYLPMKGWLEHRKHEKELLLAFMKHVFTKVPIYHPIRRWAEKRRYARELAEWQRSGKPIPPPHIVKQRTLREYSQQYGLRILVETGTYLGDMVEAMRADFDCIYSIELSSELYQKCVKRFEGVPNIEIIHGDSGSELKSVMNKIDQPALFWLDGHYSAGVTARGDKDTPIYEELCHILDAQDREHVLIIDDARCFGTDPAYPSIEDLADFVKSKRPRWKIVVQDDSIRITPN